MARVSSVITDAIRSVRPRGPVLALFAIAAVATAIAGFGLLFLIWWRSGQPDPYQTLRIATRSFVANQRVLAGEVAETAELDPGSAEDQPWRQLKLFLVSAGRVAKAEEASNPQQVRSLLADAVPVLRQSEQAGYPAGRQNEGYRLLGMSLFRVGRFDESAEALRQAVSRDPTLARDLAPTLSEAELRSTKFTPAESLATVEACLGDATLATPQRREAELIKVRSLMELGRWDEARDQIEQFLTLAEADPAQGQPEAQEQAFRLRLLRAVVDIRQAITKFGARGDSDPQRQSLAKASLANALEGLAELQREASPPIAAQARLWEARARLCQGQPDDALTRLTTVRQQRPLGPEGVVAGLEEIELLAEQGRGLEALQTTRYLVHELGDPRGFDPSLVSFEDFRRRLRNALEQLRRSGQFTHAVDMARCLPPLFEASDALVQEALGHREWALETLRQGTDGNGDLSPAAATAARNRFCAAGDAYAAAAKLDFTTPRYVASLWSAIEAYQNGRHFTRSIALLEPYLRYEERSRQSRGMVALGRALLAEGDAQRAIDALTECITEFPRDPLRYDARVSAALAHAELGNAVEASRLLRENLEDGDLTPQSPAWRNSLLTLGEVSFREIYAKELEAARLRGEPKLALLRDNQPQIQQTVRVLAEAVERYWPSEQAQMAAYLRSRAHRMAATWPRVEAEAPEILDAARRALRAQAEVELEMAREGFAMLSAHLLKRQEEVRLPERDQQLLRNCLIAEADTLRDMRRMEDAVAAYRAVSIRYMNQPTALEAILGQAWCARELGRQKESEGLIRQAAVILERIPPEFDPLFAQTTRYDRDGWQRLLGWMTSRMTTPNTGV